MSCAAVHRNASMYPAFDPTGPELFPAAQNLFHETFCIDELPDFSCIDPSPEISEDLQANAKIFSTARKQIRENFCIDELPDVSGTDQSVKPDDDPKYSCNDFDLAPDNPEPVQIVRRKFADLPERLSARLGTRLIAFDRTLAAFPQRRSA